MIELPTTIHEIDKLIASQTQESLHLDYKESRAIDRSKRAELSKDVSAFANSDGGTIIYGISEKDHFPVGKDGGVDHAEYSREWLEQVINSNISPRIDGVRISQVPLTQTKSIYVVGIPKSYRGPHQAADKKYYKRFNFQSEPMEDDEINDVRTRQNTVPPLMNVEVEMKNGVMVTLVVENIGRFPARDVTFAFPNGIKWRGGEELPRLLTQGAKVVPPGRRYRFFYNTYPEIVGGSVPSTLDMEVGYYHPEIGQRISDIFHVDFMDFFKTLVTHTELYELGETLQKVLEKLTREMEKLNRSVETISAIASPTGIDLSTHTVANLKHVVAQDDKLEKLDPYLSNSSIFRDVLGIDIQLAWDLEWFFRHQSEAKKLGEVKGINEAIMKKLQKRFDIIDEDI